MIVTLAGHVDHGKTSLVRALTGIDTDRLAEEKRRGLTIDLGFAYADIDGNRIGFVDVPGHHRFVHNMVAGVAGRQYALLVVAADDGVMPQSREHVQILRLLGLTGGVVALTKADRVFANRIDEVRQQVRTLVGGSFLDSSDMLVVSCETGTGIDELRRHLGNAASTRTGAVDNRPFRLAIDRAFTVRGSGVVVTGTVVSGKVSLDGRLVLASTGAPVRVRALHVQNESAPTAVAGDRAAVNLAGASIEQIGRGDWLLEAAVREPAARFAVRLDVLDDFGRAVKHNAPVHVYHATSHAQARILLVEGAPIQPGASAIADVVCQTPLHVKVGDRIVVRDHDLERTLGGGRVIDLDVPEARRRDPARRARLAAIGPEDPAATLAVLTRRSPQQTAAFARHWNLVSGDVDHLSAEQGLHRLGGHLLHPELLAATVRSIDARLAEHHRQHPDSPGLTAEEICVGNASERVALRLVLAGRVEAGAIRVDNGRYASASHRAAVPATVVSLFDAVRTPLDSIQPPSLGDIAKQLGRPFPTVEREMRALHVHGLAVRISETRYYLPARLLELADAAVQLDTRGPFTVREFRDATGVGRNIVIDVLEHFDAKRFTRREGDMRRVVGDASLVATV